MAKLRLKPREPDRRLRFADCRVFHPFYLRFSIRVGRSVVNGTFNLDYWGASYKQGYDDILAQDLSPLITVHTPGCVRKHQVVS